MIDTQLTRRFGLIFPIIGSPDPTFSDGRFAAAMTNAGALGVLAIADRSEAWTREQFSAAGDTSIACALDCDRLAKLPDILNTVISLRPRAIYLVNGDPRPFRKTLHRLRCRLICEAATLEEIDRCLEVEPEVLVIRAAAEKNSIAGQTTFELIPMASDYLYTRDDDVSLVASGGINDSRGLAAMIALGADGVCVGDDFWTTQNTAESSGLSGFEDSIQKALRKTGSQAQKILLNMPRKIVNEPPGTGETGVLDPTQPDEGSDS